MSTVAALWLESPLITSMMALAVVLLDVVWNLDFFVRLLSGKSLTGLSAYMFNPKVSRAIRALSLFHIVFPLLLLWMLSRLGYDRRAFIAQTLLAWNFLPPRSENINWVYGFGNEPQKLLPAPLYLLLLMILFPIIIYLPSHFLMQMFFG
jgi:signal transduction histidine kinase